MATTKRKLTTGLPAIIVIATIAMTARGDDSSLPSLWPTHELTFARMMYYDGGYGWAGGSWRVDQPEAEYYFEKGVSRLSRVDMGGTGRGVEIDLADDSLFEYPFLYSVEVGYWRLSDHEVERLREYLLRGGFLMVDDFHGPAQWANFAAEIKRVFPDRPILDVEDAAEILHVVYDVDDRIQIPGIRALDMGVTYEYGGVEPHWRAIYDDDGRIMVMINHNMDLGDAWELADQPYYPQEMTTLALHFAVNYVIYAMTH
jgi:hypothetical protein